MRIQHMLFATVLPLLSVQKRHSAPQISSVTWDIFGKGSISQFQTELWKHTDFSPCHSHFI